MAKATIMTSMRRCTTAKASALIGIALTAASRLRSQE